jgi:hypothetical protein
MVRVGIRIKMGRIKVESPGFDLGDSTIKENLKESNTSGEIQ